MKRFCASYFAIGEIYAFSPSPNNFGLKVLFGAASMDRT
jgi:hypothetical protein